MLASENNEEKVLKNAQAILPLLLSVIILEPPQIEGKVTYYNKKTTSVRFGKFLEVSQIG